MTSKTPHCIAAFAATVALCAFPATGFANSLTMTQARNAATQEAAKIKTQTSASSSSVTTCARNKATKVTCKVRSRYSTGLRSCTTDVIVYYRSRSSKKPSIAIGRSVCS